MICLNFRLVACNSSLLVLRMPFEMGLGVVDSVLTGLHGDAPSKAQWVCSFRDFYMSLKQNEQ